MSRQSESQFVVWRTLFGVYVLWTQLLLQPHMQELFGATGAFSLSGPMGFPQTLNALSGAKILCSLFLIAGRGQRTAFFGIWLVDAILLLRNPAIRVASPHIDYLHWLNLAAVFVPPGQSLWEMRRPHSSDWKMPPLVLRGAWVVFVAGYFSAGYMKIHDSPAWRDGSAFAFIFEHYSSVRPLARELIGSLSQGASRVFSYGTVLLEIAGVLLVWRQAWRKLWWIGISLMHVLALFLFQFPEITVGILLFHLFLVDAEWFRRARLAPNRLPQTKEAQLVAELL